jgi:hypothetical protein
VTRGKDVHHPPGEDRLREPVRRLPHGGQLRFHRVDEAAGFLEIGF